LEIKPRFLHHLFPTLPQLKKLCCNDGKKLIIGPESFGKPNASSTLRLLGMCIERPVFISTRDGYHWQLAKSVAPERVNPFSRLWQCHGLVWFCHELEHDASGATSATAQTHAVRPEIQCLFTISSSLSIRKERYLSSSISIRLFYKALVGEHRALSRMAWP
jgi:hypothetical protein